MNRGACRALRDRRGVQGIEALLRSEGKPSLGIQKPHNDPGESQAAVDGRSQVIPVHPWVFQMLKKRKPEIGHSPTRVQFRLRPVLCTDIGY